MPIRLFIALPLGKEAEQRLGRIIEDFRPRSRAVKWVPSQNIHLTLKFLGDTDEHLVDKISQAVDRVVSNYPAFDILIDRLGAFPNLHRPRVIWMGGAKAPEPAAAMAREIDTAMHRLDFEKEKRAFKAHLTLGRVRQGQTIGDLAEYIDQYSFEPIPLHLDRLILFKSTLTPKGAIYEPLHKATLSRERFEG